jgi:hypothetical protein
VTPKAAKGLGLHAEFAAVIPTEWRHTPIPLSTAKPVDRGMAADEIPDRVPIRGIDANLAHLPVTRHRNEPRTQLLCQNQEARRTAFRYPIRMARP